jgi:hypothetical protein
LGISRKINLGSGKDFRPDYLNLNINEYWMPDIIVDVSDSFIGNEEPPFITRRFGTLEHLRFNLSQPPISVAGKHGSHDSLEATN